MPIPPRIQIPLAWIKWTRQETWIECKGRTVGEAISELQAQYPAIGERLLDETGKPRGYVNLFVNQEDIRFLSRFNTPLCPGDELSIVLAMVGS